MGLLDPKISQGSWKWDPFFGGRSKVDAKRCGGHFGATFSQKKMHEVSAWCHFYVNHHQTTMFYHSKSPFFNLPFGEYVLFPKHLRVVNRIVQWQSPEVHRRCLWTCEGSLVGQFTSRGDNWCYGGFGVKNTPRDDTNIVKEVSWSLPYLFPCFCKGSGHQEQKQWNWWRIFPRRLPHWDVQAVIEEWQRIILGNRHATIFSNGDLFLDDFCRSNQISNMGPSGVVK